jgi:hypothetical protein
LSYPTDAPSTNQYQSLPPNAQPIRCEQTGVTIWYDPASDCLLISKRRNGQRVIARFDCSLLDEMRSEWRVALADVR